MKFRARKEGNRLEYNRELVAVYLSRFKTGTVFKCEIKRPQRTESQPLRAYYFGKVLPDFMDHLGYEKEDKLEFHMQLKMLYFDPQPDKHGFKITPTVFSKQSKVPVDKKVEFVEWVKRLAAREGCYIPNAGEV
uniref:Uncharacterized protein n=1 Tax=viral metagenome TaxID=1070528 RepID=A0A6M3Y0C0_9ZZZZ